jgi:alpha-ketoglutarate-dependent taurine dioxygenase
VAATLVVRKRLLHELISLIALTSPLKAREMDVASLAGSHGFGGVVTVTDPAAVDIAVLYDVWMEHGGFLLIRGFVSEEHPGRMMKLAQAFGAVSARINGTHVEREIDDLDLDAARDPRDLGIAVGYNTNTVEGVAPVPNEAVGWNDALAPGRAVDDGADETPLYWHTDQSFSVTPPKASCFFCAHAPDDGADTLFVNMADGYSRLPPQLQEEVQGKRGVHVLPDDDRDDDEDVAQFAVAHPLCRPHPETGRSCLYLSAENSAGVEGMP